MTAPFTPRPDPPRRTGWRETAVAALMLSAAAHAGAVYCIVADGAREGETLSAGGPVAVEVLLVEGPGARDALERTPEKPAAHGLAAAAPVADRAAASDAVAAGPPAPPETAVSSAMQHAPERREPRLPAEISGAMEAPAPPPPKPAPPEPRGGAPEQVARLDAAEPTMPATHAEPEPPTGARPGAAGDARSGSAADTEAAAPLAGNPAPAYPFAARLRGQQGRVVLRVEVRASGDAGAVAVEQSSGHASLDRAATEAVRRWRFRPAQRNSLAVAATVQVPIRFDLR